VLRVERRRYTTCSSVVKHGKAAWRDAINTQERLGGYEEARSGLANCHPQFEFSQGLLVRNKAFRS